VKSIPSEHPHTSWRRCPRYDARQCGCLGDRDGRTSAVPGDLASLFGDPRARAPRIALAKGRFRACAAAPSGPLFRERREKTATLAGNGFRRFGDRAPRRARRPPRRATRPLSGAGTDTTRPRPRRNAAEANPRASPSRCSAPTSTCPSTTSRGRYGRDAPRALDRRAAAIGGSPRGFNRRNSRSTVDSCPQSISFAGFSPALVFCFFSRLSTND
jgi:hypothetical protein